MFAEEQFLRGKFGNQYLEWSKNIPAFLPNFKNFQKPTLSFSWKKVLRKEKNGLFAIFIIFFVFDTLGELIENETQYNYFIIAAFVLTGLSYIVLKIIKKRTKLLEEENR